MIGDDRLQPASGSGPPADPLGADASVPTALLPRPKLLIVDDQPANLVALKHLLARVDAEVIPAASGNEALKLSLNHTFALVLLDVQMPEIDGYEVAELLRGEERSRDLPIIFLTAAYRDPDHRVRGYQSGAVDYLEKPIDETVLLAKVRVFLDLYRGQAERERLLRLLTEANRNLNLEIESRHRREMDAQRLAGTIFDRVAEAVLVCDLAARIIAVNPAFTRITGFSAREVEGRSPAIMGSGRQSRDFYAAMWGDLRKSGRWQGELWNRRKTGESYPIWLSIVAVRGEDDEIEKFVGIFSDITRRKQVERDLLHSRLAAERANQAKSAFLANLSHEFRAPLNAILGFSEMVLIEGEGNATGRRRDYAASIHDNGRHLLELVNDLLDLSKIEAGKWPIHPTLFPLRPLIEDCVRLMQAEAGKSGLTLTANLHQAPAVLMADQRAVRQCLFVLLSNAIRFTPAGGRITVEATVEGAMTRLRVIDSGVGIPAGDIPRLLDPFEPAEEDIPPSRSGGGAAGLGLVVVRSLVDLQGGRMAIDSSEGVGTTVTLILPTGGAPSSAS